MGVADRHFPVANESRLYAYELFEALRREIVYDTDYGLAEDETFYEKIEKDDHVAFLLRYRKQLVAGSSWHLEPGGDMPEDRILAQVMTTIIKRAEDLDSSFYNLAAAFLRGRTWAKIVGRRAPVRVMVKGKVVRERFWHPHRLRDVDKRRFELRRYQKPGGPAHWRWRMATGLADGSPQWTPIDRRDWIAHVYEDTEAAVGHGKGLNAAVFFAMWLKMEVKRSGMAFLDRWGQGLVIYSLDALAQNAVDETADDRARAALALIDKIRNGNNIVIPNVDDVKVMDPPQGGWTTAEQALTYIDNGLSRLFLGSVLPTGGNEGVGSLARAEVEDDAMAALIRFDRRRLGSTLTRDLVRQVWLRNLPIFRMLGLGDACLPKFVIASAKVSEPKERMEVLKSLLEVAPEFKTRVKVSEVLEQAGFSPAHAEDDVETLAKLSEEPFTSAEDKPNLNEVSAVVEKVAAGALPKESARAMLVSLIDTMTDEQAASILDPIEPPQQPAAAGATE